MSQSQQKLDMSKTTIYQIRIQGKLDATWSEYFGAKSTSVEQDESGKAVTIILTEPMDQAALVGLVNHLNTLGIPLISVEPARLD